MHNLATFAPMLHAESVSHSGGSMDTAGMLHARTHTAIRYALFACLLAIVTAWATGAVAGPIAWTNQGPFEECLDTRLGQWLQAQAELVVNEDPAAARLDDAAVATWTIDTLTLCRTRAGQGNADSEDRFTRHMARWRNHIYDLASSIRQKGLSD